MLESLLVFILLVGSPSLCWKGGGIFDHMCYSLKTVWSNVPKTSKQNLIHDKYALFLLICFVLQLRSKSLVKLCYLPKWKKKTWNALKYWFFFFLKWETLSSNLIQRSATRFGEKERGGGEMVVVVVVVMVFVAFPPFKLANLILMLPFICASYLSCWC